METIDQECQHLECDKPATHWPVLRIKHSDECPEDEIGEVLIFTGMCEEHTHEFTASNLITDDWWSEVVAELFIDNDLVVPSKKYSELKWVPKIKAVVTKTITEIHEVTKELK